MKNILIFAGIILLCVLILSAWFFIGNLGNFAQFLGKESTDIFANEKSRFIGSWEATKNSSLYMFKPDGSFIFSSKQGDYEINKNNTVLLNYGSYEDFSTLRYTYQFSNDDTILTLTNIDNLEDIFTLMRIQGIN